MLPENLKQAVTNMKADERLLLYAWVIQLDSNDRPEWRAELERLMSDADAGKPLSGDAMERLRREVKCLTS